MLPGTYGQWLTLVLLVSSSTISISRVVGQYKGLSLSLALSLALTLHNSNNIKRRQDKRRKEPYTLHTHTRVYELRLYRRLVSFEVRITKRGASKFFFFFLPFSLFLISCVCVCVLCVRACSFLLCFVKEEIESTHYWVSSSFGLVVTGFHAPMDVFLELNRLSWENDKETTTSYNICTGKEWHRFPSSFFLPNKYVSQSLEISFLLLLLPPSLLFFYFYFLYTAQSLTSYKFFFPSASSLLYRSWKLLYLKSDFAGQLPLPFDPSPNGTRTIPANMNDLNREEPSRYVSIRCLSSLCTYSS